MHRRVIWEDPSLEHQIVLIVVNPGARIGLSCNCLRGPRGGHKLLGRRIVWDLNYMWQVYRLHIPRV